MNVKVIIILFLSIIVADLSAQIDSLDNVYRDVPLIDYGRGNVRISNLTVINAILFVAENGCKWRALPPRFGNWHTVYMRMRRWADAGVMDRLFDALQEHHMIRVSVDCLGLDSTSVKVHPDGTGAPKKTARRR